MVNNKYIFTTWIIILILLFFYAYYSGYTSHEIQQTEDYTYQNQLKMVNKQDIYSGINQRQPYFQAYDNIDPTVNNFSRETTNSNITSVIDGI